LTSPCGVEDTRIEWPPGQADLGEDLAWRWPRRYSPGSVAREAARALDKEVEVRRLSLVFCSLFAASAMVSPTIADAAHGTDGAPVIERQHVIDYRLTPDDFFIDLCGIVTNTTVKEVDDLKTWPDGSQSFHAERSFIPDDPRLPIERGAGTSYFAPDGTMLRVIGKPIQLIGPDGGVRALDAGQTVLGDPMVLHGHHDVGINNPDLAPFYCPPSGS
jgi:hypothetical protein